MRPIARAAGDREIGREISADCASRCYGARPEPSERPRLDASLPTGDEDRTRNGAVMLIQGLAGASHEGLCAGKAAYGPALGDGAAHSTQMSPSMAGVQDCVHPPDTMNASSSRMRSGASIVIQLSITAAGRSHPLERMEPEPDLAPAAAGLGALDTARSSANGRRRPFEIRLAFGRRDALKLHSSRSSRPRTPLAPRWPCTAAHGGGHEVVAG